MALFVAIKYTQVVKVTRLHYTVMSIKKQDLKKGTSFLPFFLSVFFFYSVSKIGRCVWPSDFVLSDMFQ